MVQRLLEIISNRKRKVVGLMSGTSADGVDAALVEIEGCGLDTNLRLIEFTTHPFPEDVHNRIFEIFSPSACSVEDVCEMNFVLGDIFAEAALDVIKRAGLKTTEVDLIGSHGQTICHLPGGSVPSTLQIGEPAVIAHRTGIVTVGDFRVADVAVGGQGAPLVPYVDFLLFRDNENTRVVQNIGGISNVTVLPAGGSLGDILAFDTGPGNMVIDEVVKIITDGQKSCDRNGEMASKGVSHKYLYRKLLSHPFVVRRPPKTTGREEFGARFASEVFKEAKRLGISDLDIVTTVTVYTAECIFINYELFILPEYDVSEILISGGGLHNLTLMNLLREKFHPIPVEGINYNPPLVKGNNPLIPPLKRGMGDFGLLSDAKEAVAFAVLANETIHGNPGNVPSATGADRPVVLGKIVV